MHQEWIDYPEFDLAHHVRRVAIPRPGDDAELSRAIAHALERPLDLDRPLWECWVIEGLKGNRWAILMKIHHRLADGNPRRPPAHPALRRRRQRRRSPMHAAAGPVSRPPARTAGLGRCAVAGIRGPATGAVVGAIWPLLQTPPIDPVATMRRYGTVRVPIADVDRVCRKFGVTVNDVALAAITEGFRTVLLHRGEEPRADSLRTLVPTPRPFMLPYLPVDHDDPVQRLRTVQTRWNDKQTDQPQSGGIIESAINSLPTACARQRHSAAVPAPAARHRDVGDQRARATPPAAADGPDDGALAADPPDRRRS